VSGRGHDDSDVVGPPRRWLEIAALACLGAMPGVVMSDVIARSYSVATALGASAVAAVIAVVASQQLTGHRHRVLTQAVIAAVGSAVVVVVVAALAPGPSFERRSLLSAVSNAVTHGWSAVITSPVPADAAPPVLVPLALLVFGSTATATTLAMRGRSHVAALLPVITAFVLAAVAAGSHQFRPVLTGLAVVGAAAVVLTARHRSQPATTRRSPAQHPAARTELGLAVGIIAVAAAVGVGVGPSLAFGRDGKPFDPREHLVPPTVPSGAVSPLDQVASRHQNPDQLMFTVNNDEAVFTRLIALETYDGARWTTAGAYQRTGTEIAAPRRTNVTTRPSRSRIAVSGLTGPWMPSTGDPTRISGVSVLIDPASGSLLAASGDAAGATYTIDANVSLPDLQTLPSLAVSTDTPAASRVPPGLPAPLQEMAEVATRGATQPLAQAVLLERYLHLSFTIDDTLAAGQSYGHLVKALTENRAGTEEQFAVAFAVLGRVVGLPTRVVVGFAPGEQTAPGSYAVRAGDARVWPEVNFDGVGWVAFDPAPTRNDEAGRVSVGVGGSQGIEVREGGDNVRPIGGDPQGDEPAAAPDSPVSADRSTFWQRAAVSVAATLAVVLIAGPLVIVTAKRRRTARRRHNGSPRQQVLGAWHDVLDRFVEIGVSDPRQRTVEELVEYSQPATPILAGLYRPVNRALYDDREPADTDPAQAWKSRDRFVRAIRKDTSLRSRIRWAVDPRPLLHDQHRKGQP
jgi:transglutaminase-like putative cysteine protease